MVNYTKLKTNLKLAIQRLKLLERKKTENAKKATKEIADYIQINKYDRARIKVEHIIREDYMVEGMEIVEMYCDLLLARFGLVESMKELEPGLDECIASLIWVTPRLESECAELKVIADELESKYGKDFAQLCRANKMNKVNERLMLKMSEQAPGELLVEKYLVEIAKSHNVKFTPNPEIAVRDPYFFYDSLDQHEKKLAEQHNKNINNNNNNRSGGNGGSGGSGGGGSTNQASKGDDSTASIYPTKQQVSYIGFNQAPQPNSSPIKPRAPPEDHVFDLPSVPNNHPDDNQQREQTDSFDDLASRFAKLKK